eukprot:TRINITY_DN2025_c0_g1_i1.p1 TRINITY_DN2025_c0_g1~~TRINITY_DN2025_c0_g1_i1.p1  ORF type:complete len:356 (+),score=141.94 TRINITY_DN2025_c0_g1_i1:922-1989(+)
MADAAASGAPGVAVCALYRFVVIDDVPALQQELLEAMESHGVMGSLLVAPEGVNGTVAGSAAGINGLLEHLNSDSRFAGITHKLSYTATNPFARRKVKIKKEIVTMGVEGLNPSDASLVGAYVEPKDWNALISDPDVVVVDTRNDYECQIGTFRNAVNPKTEAFTEFPKWVGANLAGARQAKKKIAMFCTGGIRCEKATAYMKKEGFGDVYHLKGGVLKYLEDVPAGESLWDGECYVFDERVSVNHALQRGEHVLCDFCSKPVHPANDPLYTPGLCCAACHATLDDARRERYAARQLHAERAGALGLPHTGAAVGDGVRKRKLEKLAAKDEARKAAKLQTGADATVITVQSGDPL